LRQEFGAIAVGERAFVRARSTWRTAAASKRVGGRSVRTKRPSPSSATCSSKTFAVAQGEARRRQRVDHFVREQHAVPRLLRRGVEPFDQVVEQRVEAFAQAFLLACAQVGARLEDGVARGQGVGGEQLLERDFGERTAAAAEFDDVGTGPELLQHRREAVGDAGGEQGAELGCGDEVARGAELGRARAVVAQAGRVEAQLHEARRTGSRRPRRWICSWMRAAGVRCGPARRRRGAEAGDLPAMRTWTANAATMRAG
jgi:hypothetical protein